MAIKKLLFCIGRSVLKFTLLFSVLWGSFVGLGVAYRESPYLFMSEIDETAARKQRDFIVAFKSADESGKEEVKILPYRMMLGRPAGEVRSFRLRDGEFELNLPIGEGSVAIQSETNNQNIQTTTVYVVGDTPWVSVSVYAVNGAKIVPLKLGRAPFWLFFVAFIVPLYLVVLAQKPVGRIVEKVFPPKT